MPLTERGPNKQRAKEGHPS